MDVCIRVSKKRTKDRIKRVQKDRQQQLQRSKCNSQDAEISIKYHRYKKAKEFFLENNYFTIILEDLSLLCMYLNNE